MAEDMADREAPSEDEAQTANREAPSEDEAQTANYVADAGADRLAEPVDLEQPPRLGFTVVAIGASAGGLEAFTSLFSAMPSDSGMAFVLVQHLAPDRESLVAEILQRHTAMPVEQVEDGMEVQQNHVYVIRPGHTLTIKDGRLHLGERLERPGHGRPVDDFFRSLAEEQRERAVCVIMSGMGSNGAAGAQAIKAVGGLCIAQDPETAQFPSMPRHLIDAGYADLVLAPPEIPEALSAYARHPYAVGRGNGSAAAGSGPETVQREQQQVREILAVVRTRTRFDFTGYKKPTVLRRIQRRMGLNRVTDLGSYAKLLRQSTVEVTGLADDLLIHVTGFFRDAEAWEALRQLVVEPLVRSREPDSSVRCWVAACSSGEEAYSLAMLLVEESERAGKRLEIKVFATDTAERTLSNARHGVYPGGIESEMPPERLNRFFDRDDAMYRVRQDLRERVVFAPQNILSDPPFSRLDIVTCRNLLIYLEPAVQQRVFNLIHFGLREGGALFLGTSETAATNTGMFEVLDKKARIYRRVGPTRHGSIDFTTSPVATGVSKPGHGLPASGPAPSIGQLTARALLALHTPAAVTVDRDFRIVYYHGDTKPYLEQPSGEPTQDLWLLATEQVRGALRVALQRSASSGTVERVPDGYIVGEDGQRRRIVVTVSPLIAGKSSNLFVVSFQQGEEQGPAAAPEGPKPGAEPALPAEEVQRLRDELQSVIEELQASNEEHRAAAEEAMSINEELQSSNEELETSKEEMQSLNEELSTVNAQLQAKMEELQQASSDLRSLLASTDIAVIFLDSQFRIRRYTPAARRLLELINSDIGRPLQDLAKKFTDPELFEDAQSVLSHLVPAEREIESFDGRWYVRRVLPYRTVDDRIEGVVITFVDITERKRAHDVLATAGEATGDDLRGMRSLHHAAGSLLGAKDMAGVLDEILIAALELNATSQGDLQLCEPQPGAVRLAAYRGLPSELLHRWVAVSSAESNGPVARALRERAAVLVNDVEAELPRTPLSALWLSAGVRGVHAVPLITRDGDLLGIMNLYFRKSPHSGGSSIITPLLARLAADAIDRMRIQEERARLLRSEQLARRALDEAVQIKDDFLATLSHELRTPLSAITLWGKILRNQPSSPEQTQIGLDAIISSADAQGRLIDDLIESSRAAAGKLQIELKEVDLAEILRSVIEQNNPAASAKSLRIEASFSPDVGTVLADPLRLRQVLWNLLANALKFTPEGGHVRISLTRHEGEVHMAFADNGIGITPEFLPYVFDRFRQYEASVTRKHGGLGLGLSISKQLVEMHGGSIRAESEGAGMGATFTVILPMPANRRAGAPSPADPPPRAAALAGKKVLIVEDDSPTLLALRVTLESAGAEVTCAGSAAEAVRLFGAARPDVVLSDIGLPDQDGYALLGRLRDCERKRSWSQVPAVALSAYTREEDRGKAAAAGFASHIPKPADADDLVTGLLDAMRGR
jgi:two-component system CheB/CheR fusion protein